MLINAIFLAADGLSLYGMSKNSGIGETRYLTNEFILRGDFGSFTLHEGQHEIKFLA